MIVVDASVWVSFLVSQDVNHTVTHRWLRSMLATGEPVAAPVLLLAEVGGAVSRRIENPDTGEKTVKQLLSIPTLHLVGIDHALGIQAGRIAARHHLRGADATYVAVATELNVPLVSWDREHLERTSELVVCYTPT